MTWIFLKSSTNGAKEKFEDIEISLKLTIKYYPNWGKKRRLWTSPEMETCSLTTSEGKVDWYRLWGKVPYSRTSSLKGATEAVGKWMGT